MEHQFPNAVVEIIDYVPEISKHYNQTLIWPQGRKLPVVQAYLRQQAFHKFLRKHCRFTSPLSCDSLEEGIDTIASFHFDAVFVGSDTVFQLDGYFGHCIAGPKPPNLYFLPGNIGCPKFALAASCDPLTVNPTSLNLSDNGLEALQDFSAIGYRDANTKKLLQHVAIPEDRIGFLPDPTILSCHEITETYGVPHPIKESNLVGVYIGNPVATSRTIAQLNASGYETIDLLRNTFWPSFADPIAAYIQPFAKLKGLVTDRFHGTIISQLVGNYPVLGLEDVGRYPHGGKLADLYQRLGIQDALLRVELGRLDTERVVRELTGLFEHTADKPLARDKIHKMSVQGEQTFAKMCAPTLRQLSR